MQQPKPKAPRNRTLSLSAEEISAYSNRLITLHEETPVSAIINRTIHQELLGAIPFLPKKFVDLLIIDPPYNLNKDFGDVHFRETSNDNYAAYLEQWFPQLLPLLKDNASVYICCDWKSSAAIFSVTAKYLTVRNRITWEREKGRGAKANWKNSCEDIWFATVGNDYYFNVDAVKVKRKVIAPYKVDGQPKDWEETEEGGFRITHPSNFWNDISIPYWSMPENTPHPTQKPEKLIAKLILASCPEGGMVFDPFLGSGTTSATAKKLGRTYCGIEVSEEYCCYAEKRLAAAESDKRIQGYEGGVFWERNSLKFAKSKTKKGK
jgi:site-specific DNA-methyltransferase (adenine-specific)